MKHPQYIYIFLFTSSTSIRKDNENIHIYVYVCVCIFSIHLDVSFARNALNAAGQVILHITKSWRIFMHLNFLALLRTNVRSDKKNGSSIL